MPTMRVLKVCCGAVALVLAAWSFVACGSRGEPEITEDRAVKSAVAFVKRLGLDADVAKPRVRRTRTSVYPNPPYDVSFADAGTVAVDARTGSVLSYWRSNLAPPPAGGGRKPPPLDTDAQIDAYMKALAKRLGATDKMVYSGARRRGWDPATTVRHGGPSIEALFQVIPYGYRMLFPCDGMDISVNAVSGALQGYHRLGPRPYVVESHDAKLTFDQAEAVAKQIVSKCSVGVWRPADGDLRPQVGPPPAAAPSFLAYVTPNGTFSAPNYTDKPVRLRLAWVLCYPRSDEIWIDAADGKVLGGAYDSTKG